MRNKALKVILAALFWLAAWFIAAKTVNSMLLIPSPAVTVKALWSLLCKKSFYSDCAFSLLRVLSAWLGGMLAGTLLAVITSLSSAANTLLSPALGIIKATPVASFIILALVMMKTSFVPVFTSALIVIPVVWANISKGVSSPDPKLLEMASAFNMKRTKKLKVIYIPAVMPYFSAAATTSMGLAWKSCIAAEVIASPNGSIGAGIQNAKIYLETPELFAWTLVIILFSMAFEKLIAFVIGRSMKKDDTP